MGGQPLPQSKYNMADGRYLENRNDVILFSAVDVPIWTKFDSLMQNIIRITVMWSKSKPEVEFQYGRRLFFKNGST